jgi:Homeodomain-like domain
MTTEEQTRCAVVQLLKEGYATPAEIATEIGRSRQIVRYWGKGIDWQEARAKRIKARLKALMQEIETR